MNRRIKLCHVAHIAASAILSLFGALIVFQAIATASAEVPEQSWPQRPVRFILPFSAGTGTDLEARLMAERLSVRWHQPIVVENRFGADGLLAINSFISANDDHVLLYASTSSFLAHPYTLEKLPYHLGTDITPIVRISDIVFTASVPSSLGPNSLKAVVELAKAKPGKLNAGAAAGLTRFTLNYFLRAEELNVASVPYKDGPPAVTDLSAGRLQFMLSSYAIVRSASETGLVKVIAVSLRERAAFAPDIPTIFEAGFPSLDIGATTGVFGRRGMARELRERIARDATAVMNDLKIAERLAGSGQAMRLGGPDDLLRTLRDQEEQTAKVAKALGLAAAK
jgi:tripartite-type tricarboxylate transporter receptor subunit TctC